MTRVWPPNTCKFITQLEPHRAGAVPVTGAKHCRRGLHSAAQRRTAPQPPAISDHLQQPFVLAVFPAQLFFVFLFGCSAQKKASIAVLVYSFFLFHFPSLSLPLLPLLSPSRLFFRPTLHLASPRLLVSLPPSPSRRPSTTLCSFSLPQLVSTYINTSKMLAIRAAAGPARRQCFRAAPRAAATISLQVRRTSPGGNERTPPAPRRKEGNKQTDKQTSNNRDLQGYGETSLLTLYADQILLRQEGGRQVHRCEGLQCKTHSRLEARHVYGKLPLSLCGTVLRVRLRVVRQGLGNQNYTTIRAEPTNPATTDAHAVTASTSSGAVSAEAMTQVLNSWAHRLGQISRARISSIYTNFCRASTPSV